jgi:hypothetical protein
MTVEQEKDMTDDMTVEQWLAIRKEAAHRSIQRPLRLGGVTCR